MTQDTARDEMVDGDGGVRAHWRALLGVLTGIGSDGLRIAGRRLERAFEDEGIFSVLPGTTAQDQPWRCDPVPMILPEQEFVALECGLAQRARLLEAVLADLAGPRRLLTEGLLPPALLFANPGFLRLNELPNTGNRLTCYAADLIRGSDGTWRVLADRVSTGGGISFARENRRILARVLPETFRAAPVRELRPFFDRWQDSLRRMAPHGGAVAVLTPGTRDRRWFEHMFLARELGSALVEGGDLTVRDGILFLKSLRGLQRVDVLVRRVDGRLLDPLELENSRRLGVAALLDAVRAGNLRIVNDPAAGVMEAPAFIGFLPTLAPRLLGEALIVPGVPSLWLGDPDALARTREGGENWYFRPAMNPAAAAILPAGMTSAERAELDRRIAEHPGQWVAIAPGAISVVPSLTGTGLEPKPVILRMFLIFDAGRWHAMPGGLARVLDDPARIPGGIPRGGMTKDVWVLSEEGANLVGPSALASAPLRLRRTAGDLPSRVADNLFWLGRHVERAERSARLVRAAVARLARGTTMLPREQMELVVLGHCLADAGVVPDDSITPANLGNLSRLLFAAVRPDGAIGEQFDTISRLTESVRDRLTGDMYATFTQAMRTAQLDIFSVADSLDGLAHAMVGILRFSTAVAGVAAENMVRGGGWIFLDLGRRIERAQAVTSEIGFALEQPAGRIETGLRLILELCDSVITYRNRYMDVLQPAPVLDLVLADPGNPRGLAFQLIAMHGLLDDLSGESGGREMLAGAAAGLLAEAEANVGFVLAAADQATAAGQIPQRLAALSAGLATLSDRITRRYFALLPAAQLVGADAGEPDWRGAA